MTGPRAIPDPGTKERELFDTETIAATKNPVFAVVSDMARKAVPRIRAEMTDEQRAAYDRDWAWRI